jgi:hypothetical protein
LPAPRVDDSTAEATPSRMRRLMDDHPALLLTAGYLILTIVGLIYEFWLFLSFRINIVDWAETTDFLLAAVRTPLVIVLSLVPLPLAIALDRFGKRLRARYPRYRAYQEKQERLLGVKPHHRVFYSGAFVFTYAVLFTQLYAFRVSKQIRAGKGKIVRVQPVGSPEGSAIQGVLIGTTSKYLFLWDTNRTMTRILPVENVAQVLVPRRRSTDPDTTGKKP